MNVSMNFFFLSLSSFFLSVVSVRRGFIGLFTNGFWGSEMTWEVETFLKIPPSVKQNRTHLEALGGHF